MSDSPATSTGLKIGRTLFICAALILASVVVLYVINSTEPQAEREAATLRRAMLVEVFEAKKGDYRPIISETGTVAPSREVQLAPQVGGRIISLHSDFNPGGFIRAGEVVLKIETADYENLLAQRESELIEAETELAVEMGRQEVAKRDFELLGERLPEGEDTLVLREPQLAAAKTRVDAAKTALEQAKLNLERIELRSPFDAQILSRMADLGSQVSQNMPVAQIVGIEQYWVMATVSPAKLPYIDFPKGDAVGSRVELIKRGGSAEKRVGRLLRPTPVLPASSFRSTIHSASKRLRRTYPLCWWESFLRFTSRAENWRTSSDYRSTTCVKTTRHGLCRVRISWKCARSISSLKTANTLM